MITVACVLNVGPGCRYGPQWVTRLRAMVARHLSLPHRFVCLANVEVPGVQVIPLRHRWPGWWAKVELFSGRLPGERLLYLDLDVLVTGSLDQIAQHPAPIIFCPPHPVLVGYHVPDTARVTYRYQTSCMAWSPPNGREIYSAFNPEVIDRLAGDQDWIAEVNGQWPTMSREWFRKLRNCRDGPPPGVKVVLCMPEKNDVASSKYQWVRDVWHGTG